MTMNNMAAFQQGINTPEYLADEFRMYQFKVIQCNREDQHDWCECPFLHPGEKVRRRDPKAYNYSSQACESFRKTGQCKNGDDCNFAHGVFECRLHPQRYKTEMCSDGERCSRRICFFAHTEKELRFLSPRSAFVINRGQGGSNNVISNSSSSNLQTFSSPPYMSSNGLNLQNPAPFSYRPPQMQQDQLQAPLMDLSQHQMFQQMRPPRPPPPTPGTRSPPSPFENAPLPNPGVLPSPGASPHLHSNNQAGRFTSDQHELLLYLADAVQGLLLQSQSQAAAAGLNGGSSSSRVSVASSENIFNPHPPPQHQGMVSHNLHNVPTPESLAKAVQSLMLMQGYEMNTSEGPRGISHSAHQSAHQSPSFPASFSPNTPSPISQFASAQMLTPPSETVSSGSVYVNRHVELLKKSEEPKSLQQTDSFELLLSQLPRHCAESSVNLGGINLSSKDEGKRG